MNDYENRKIIYLETSAINYFENLFSFEDAAREEKYAKNNGLALLTSPVSFYEILLTSDHITREKIIHFAQHFIPNQLLPSPEELIIEYIAQGCPEIEPRRKLNSTSNLSKVWQDLIEDKQKTFAFERSELVSKMQINRKLGRSLRGQMSNNYRDELLGDGLRPILEAIVNKLTSEMKNNSTIGEQKIIYRISLFLIFVILCCEFTFDSQIFEEFWKNIKIDNQLDRLAFILINHEELVYRGPFLTMATMAIAQSKRTHSRGIWMDCLHSVYLPYADQFLSDDQHFCDLSETNILFKKIKMVKTFKYK